LLSIGKKGRWERSDALLIINIGGGDTLSAKAVGKGYLFPEFLTQESDAHYKFEKKKSKPDWDPGERQRGPLDYVDQKLAGGQGGGEKNPSASECRTSLLSSY